MSRGSRRRGLSVLGVMMLCASALGAAPARHGELLEFWQMSLTELARWPLEFTWEAQSGVLTYTGYEGALCRGVVVFPWHEPPFAGAVLHLGSEGAPPATNRLGDSYVHMYVNWNAADAQARWRESSGTDPRGHVLFPALLNAYQALEVLRTVPGVNRGEIGVVGEGLGAWQALALAALCGAEIPYVVAYQPWPVRRRGASGGGAVPGGMWLPGVGGAYLEALSFAPHVTSPALVIGGERDALAPVQELLGLHALLRGPRELIVIPGWGHQPAGRWVDWESTCRRWISGRGWSLAAGTVSGWAAGRWAEPVVTPAD